MVRPSLLSIRSPVTVSPSLVIRTLKAALSRIPADPLPSFRLWRWSRAAEFRGVNLGIRLHFGQLRGGLTVRPGHSPAERHLDTGKVAVILIVDLCWNAAH